MLDEVACELAPNRGILMGASGGGGGGGAKRGDLDAIRLDKKVAYFFELAFSYG